MTESKRWAILPRCAMSEEVRKTRGTYAIPITMNPPISSSSSHSFGGCDPSKLKSASKINTHPMMLMMRTTMSQQLKQTLDALLKSFLCTRTPIATASRARAMAICLQVSPVPSRRTGRPGRVLTHCHEAADINVRPIGILHGQGYQIPQDGNLERQYQKPEADIEPAERHGAVDVAPVPRVEVSRSWIGHFALDQYGTLGGKLRKWLGERLHVAVRWRHSTLF
ncbi:hypothetical protein GE09DRAFT_431119 [Coniochaeta sp. 2T2.1]|nr:hypothetical protein GE09DRAFT_431119 [Coniochaeta sp. 2T2.1]